MNKKSSIAVIGAGPMGLMTCYELLKQNYEVTLFERDIRIGGMTAAFDLGDLTIERFYHFICATDYNLFALLKELNLYEKLMWNETKMGFYYDGNLYKWGDPLSLLRFPGLGLISKLRYGLNVVFAKNINNWGSLDKKNAITWLKKWIGEKAYNVLWQSLFDLKFYNFKNDLSAAWIAARIQRMAKSRKNIFAESLGYIQGGSEVLLNAIEKQILALGGKIKLGANVSKVTIKGNKVTGIIVDAEMQPFDAVVSTIPLPYVVTMVPELPQQVREQISSIDNVGVACVVLKLKHKLSPYFWLNINDSRMQIPGVIEYSNLNPLNKHIVYVPYYLPQSHAKYKYQDTNFFTEVYDYLRLINPDFRPDWVLNSHVARYAYAQTVCTTNFYQRLPEKRSSICGFYMADTAYYYPEDRCISESVAVGKQLAEMVNEDYQ